MASTFLPEGGFYIPLEDLVVHQAGGGADGAVNASSSATATGKGHDQQLNQYGLDDLVSTDEARSINW